VEKKKGSGALKEGQYNEYTIHFFGPDFYIWFKYVAKKMIILLPSCSQYYIVGKPLMNNGAPQWFGSV
jgi:hypothetical protein